MNAILSRAFNETIVKQRGTSDSKHHHSVIRGSDGDHCSKEKGLEPERGFKRSLNKTWWPLEWVEKKGVNEDEEGGREEKLGTASQMLGGGN